MKQLLTILFLTLCASPFAQPTAGFTVSTSTACVGDTITMTSTSVPNGSPIVNYRWSAQGAVVEQAEGANMTSFSFVYAIAGTYNLSLIVQDQNGLSDNSFQTNAIQVFAKPAAVMNVSTLSCTGPFQLSFNNTGSATGAGIQSTWTFPGGTPATFTGNQTNVNYAAAGQYTATLRVTESAHGCYSELIKPLNLNTFIADFIVPTTICRGTAFQLLDASTIGANTWSWSCTGGTISTPSFPNPMAVFNTPGTYTITLNTSNTIAGCSDSETKTVTVVDLPPVSFTTSGSTFGCAPKDITFVNTTPNSPGATFEWNFDDGSTFTGMTPPDHPYVTNNRMFFPTLTITAANGCKNTIKGDTIYLFPPEAHFSFNNPNGCAPMSVQFNDESYSPEPIINWSWDFGDGTTSTQVNPNHSFGCDKYDVMLAIETQSGCRDTTYLSDAPINQTGPDNWTTYPDNVTVTYVGDSIIYRRYSDISANNFQYVTIRYGQLFTPDFVFTPPVLCSNEPLMLTSTVPPPCPPEFDITYNWLFEGFGSGSSIVPDFTKVFNDTLHMDNPMDLGLYVNFRGCITDTTTKIDQVYLKGPVSRFAANGNFCNIGEGPHGVDVNDDASIYGHIGYYDFNGSQVVTDQAADDVEVVYRWGDGSETTITDDPELEDADKGATSHVFQGYGTYTITQLITNHTTGCADSTTRTVFISFMDASILTDTVCNLTPYKVDAAANTPGDHLPVTYAVSNGSSNFSTISFTEATVPAVSQQNFIQNVSGTATLTLIAVNSVGCRDTIIQPLRVLALPEAVIGVLDDTICKNSTLEFWANNSIPGDFPVLTTADWKIGNQHFFGDIDDTMERIVPNQITLDLTVTDGFGCVSQNDEILTVHTQGPTADFSHDQYLCNDVSALLDGSHSSGNGISYEWFLDNTAIPDSNTDSLYNTIHVMPESLLNKNYMYTLVVTDNKNCTDTITKTVYVSNPRITGVQSVVEATYVDINGNFTCPPVIVDFALSYVTSFDADDYKWSFGNDGFDTDFDSYNANPVGIQYNQAGSYNLYVEMEEDVTGCIFSYSEVPFLTIGGPSADLLITSDPNAACGMSYIFEVLNPSDNLHRWSWDLGDGTIVTNEQEPDNIFTHTYLNVDDYSPQITIYDDSSLCSIPIPPFPLDAFQNGLNAFFEIVPADPVVDLDLSFNDLSTSSNSDQTIVSWIWDFGDGDSIVSPNNSPVNHIYLEDTAQFITLTIVDQKGCTDQYTLPVDIFKVNFLLPNIITAVGTNGENSVFKLFDDIFNTFTVVIVNRWGNVVYEGSRDPSNPLYLWNGIDTKSGEPCSDGVYFFVIKGMLKNGKYVEHQDFLTLAGRP